MSWLPHPLPAISLPVVPTPGAAHPTGAQEPLASTPVPPVFCPLMIKQEPVERTDVFAQPVRPPQAAAKPVVDVLARQERRTLASARLEVKRREQRRIARFIRRETPNAERAGLTLTEYAKLYRKGPGKAKENVQKPTRGFAVRNTDVTAAASKLPAQKPEKP